MTPELAFPPLPVRRRGVLEVVDTALKLYRRYFGVLMGWSLLVAATWLLSVFVPFAYLLTLPLTYGSAACCIAAAVRGQKVTFSQVWEFTKPRYGALIGLFLLSLLIITGVFLAFLLVGGLLFLGAYYALLNAPTGLQVTSAIIGYILALVLYAVVAMVTFLWQNIVMFIVCLEDDKRGAAALGRAWQLLQGHWRNAFGLSLLLTISVLVVFGIIGGLMALIGQAFNVFSPGASEWAVLGLMAGMSGIAALFFLFWMPAQAMVTAVHYLDLRVRKEALDLEWTAYSSAPPTASPNGTDQLQPASSTSGTSNVAREHSEGHHLETPSSFGGSTTSLPPLASPPPTIPALVTPPSEPPRGAKSVDILPPTPSPVAPSPGTSSPAVHSTPSQNPFSDASSPTHHSAPAPSATSSFAPPPSSNALNSMPSSDSSPLASAAAPFDQSSFGDSSSGSENSENSPTASPSTANKSPFDSTEPSPGSSSTSSFSSS